ncbi:hypothetical protein POPTR_017G120000v4 [Populus trichocarpa]|uniref:Uncharacterized protein n=1 Tax=Populus trichocarpa TaxID=3694 RepID=A0ACC0RQR2_POPTR|nr:nuclear transcription factor Y subunit C-2 [Populus trichocarpa]KAI9379621.1 hypothetical protein POPTR_017G120000v4 [Populus trichocarpa]
MDLNQSIELDLASADPSPQEIENALPMNSSMLPYHQTTKELQHKQNLDEFWNQQLLEIYNTTASKSNNMLPLARIKRVMKSDGDVKMISAETPILFSKACELFILELTLRSWLQTTSCKRRTLQRCDISRVIRQEDMLNFLNRVVPCDQKKEDEVTKCTEEMESLPNMQMPAFPFLDLNGEVMMDENSHEDPQELMIKPPMPSSDFTSGSASKWAN